MNYYYYYYYEYYYYYWYYYYYDYYYYYYMNVRFSKKPKVNITTRRGEDTVPAAMNVPGEQET